MTEETTKQEKEQRPAEETAKVEAAKKEAPVKKEVKPEKEATPEPVVDKALAPSPKQEKGKKSARPRKKKKKVSHRLVNGRGHAHIKATYNNTIVTVTDQLGNTIAWASSGKCGFKGPKKSTPYAAGVVVKSIVEQCKAMGVKEVDCFVKGVGTGREAAVRALHANGISISAIKDVTGVPHNGCRPRKPRRV